MTDKRWISLILAIFVLLGAIYALLTPIFEASDELWHYPMVRHLSDGNPLPVQVFDPAEAGPWKQEASQPPLYYYLGAALTFWIDTSDMESVRWLNPHVDNGVITEDGNTNLVVHDPQRSLWEGTALAVRIVRLFSVLLGAVTVYLTYRIAKRVAPDRPEIYIGAAAINAFTPMFLFISGAVNNDNLVITLSSLALLLTIEQAFDVERPDRYWQEAKGLLILGIVIGLGALTKMSALGLIPLAWVGVFVKCWRREGQRDSAEDKQLAEGSQFVRALATSLGQMAILMVPVLLIAGWWYLRNLRLYDDWSGWNAFIAVLGKRATPANLAQLWDERWGFLLSYWGLFGGLNVPMAEWIYRLLNWLALLSTIGFTAYLVWLVLQWWSERRRQEARGSNLLADAANFLADNVALILCLLWIAAVVVGLVRWATVTWSSQGRLIFSAISALSVVFTIGLVVWLPSRLGKIVMGILAGFLFVVSAIAPWLWIKPAYELSPRNGLEFRVVNETFDNSLTLQGFAVQEESIMPGEKIELFLKWESAAETDRDWSIFVHLNDPDLELLTAQRDMYPVQGLLATSLLAPDDSFTGKYVLEIPDTAVTPAELELTVGLYDYYKGDRAVTENGADAVVLDTITLLKRPGDLPNPISVLFEDQFELVGFSINPRRAVAGSQLQVDLYYKAVEDLTKDYSFFTQIVGDDTTRWASHDIQLPTTEWKPGEIQRVSFSLELENETPAGILPVIVGVYSRTDDGGFDRLQRLTAEGRLTDDFLILSEIRVDSAK